MQRQLALQPRYEDEADVADVDTGSLVFLARNGDRDAFAELIERHYELIYRTAFKWSGNRSDAEDVAQEVAIKLGSAIRGFDGRSAFTSWVYRITLNAVRDMVRVRVRQTRKAEALALVTPDEAEPEQEAGINARAIWDAVRSLPDKQRDAVLLVYAEELSHAQAAQIMGIKEATVSWHVHEAKKALRGLL